MNIIRGLISIPTRMGDEEATRNQVFFAQMQLNFRFQNRGVVKSPLFKLQRPPIILPNVDPCLRKMN